MNLHGIATCSQPLGKDQWCQKRLGHDEACSHEVMHCPTCDGNTYVGRIGVDEMRCYECAGKGLVAKYDLTEIVPVIFRRDSKSQGGDCFAMFPTIPSDTAGRYITSYQHIGQHSSADYVGCINRSMPCDIRTEEDVRELYQELYRIGYRMKIVQRNSRAMQDSLRAEIARLREIK